jgi:hypothetical protein
MKKLTYLFLALFIVACSSDSSSNDNDSTAPIITLNGEAIATVNLNSTYTDAGATATDEVDGDLTSSIVTTGVVNTSIEGNYIITYTVSDTSGNTATATRQVVVEGDTTAPVITILGEADVSINQYTPYIDAGATATDNVDGDLTSSIVTTGVVNTSIEGNYIITYTVSDTSGNTATATRQVVVVVQNLAIGQSYQGGIIAYIDSTGQHGLIVATADQSEEIQWWNGSYVVTGATGTAIGTGLANTNAIIAAQGSGSYAASIARDYNGGGYTDWYLPSKDELNQLYVNKAAIGGGFANDYYWSSTEYDSNYTWLQYFSNGAQDVYIKGFPIYVRAVRAF